MKKLILSFVVVAMMIVSAKASHQVAGDIGWTCLGNNQYEFYVYFYRDCNGVSAPSSFSLAGTSSCGNVSIPMTGVDLDPNDPSEMGAVDTIGLCPSFQTTCAGGNYPGVRIYKYIGTTTLAPCSNWSFCYSTCCRNAAPSFPPLTATTNYTGASMAYYGTLNNADGTCDDSPVWNKPPRAYVCQDIPTVMDNGATDADGDSIVYELIDVLDGCGTNTINYNAPFSNSYPFSTVSGTFPFDPTTGESIFTPLLTPNQFEVSVLGVKISEYRNGVLKGTIVRDMQIVTIQGCDPLNAVSQGVNQIGGSTDFINDTLKVCAGDTLDFSVLVIDPINNDPFDLRTNLTKVLPNLDFSFDTFQAINVTQGVFLMKTTINDVGVYNFNVEAVNDGCPIEITKIFDFVLEIIPSTVAEVDLDTTCYNNSDSIVFRGYGGTAFNWYDLDGNPADLDNPNEQFTYGWTSTTKDYVLRTDLGQFGCKDRDTVRVTVAPKPEILGNLEICFEDTTILTIGWDWEPSEYLVRMWNDDEDLTDTSFMALTEGNYMISLTDTIDKTGRNYKTIDPLVCTLSDTVLVEVVDCPVNIPNIFTPNGDKHNDVFRIDNIDREVWNLKIYSRWGKKVLIDILDYKNDWDGGDLSDGVYYYTLTNQDGAIVTEFKGWVQIAR